MASGKCDTCYNTDVSGANMKCEGNKCSGNNECKLNICYNSYCDAGRTSQWGRYDDDGLVATLVLSSLFGSLFIVSLCVIIFMCCKKKKLQMRLLHLEAVDEAKNLPQGA